MSRSQGAQPFAAQCEAGNVCLLRGRWNQDYLEELCAFPLSVLKDQVDATSGAFNKLVAKRSWSAAEIVGYGQNKVVSDEPIIHEIIAAMRADGYSDFGNDFLAQLQGASSGTAGDRHGQWLADVERQQAEALRRLRRGC